MDKAGQGHQYTRQFYDCLRHIAIDPDKPQSISKLVCLNLRTPDPNSLYKHIFRGLPEDDLYVDWDKLPSTHRLLQDSRFWIYLLSTYCDIKVPDTNVDMKTSVKQNRMLIGITESLSKSRISISWKDTVVLFLLINIARVPSLNISKIFLADILGRDVDSECVMLIGGIADTRYTNEDFYATMSMILNEYVVENTPMLSETIQKIRDHNLGVRDTFAAKNVKMSIGRLRLRDRLRQKERSQVLAERNTFEAFQTNANFASSVSYYTKLRLYMIMSQHNIDKTYVFNQVFPKHLHYVLKGPVIETPDIDVIKAAISKVRYMKPPFALMTQFYNQCFKSIAFTKKNALSLSTIMQLYISIYQDQRMWQECWKEVLPVMNAQVVRDIDTFRQANPQMDMSAFAYALGTIK